VSLLREEIKAVIRGERSVADLVECAIDALPEQVTFPKTTGGLGVQDVFAAVEDNKKKFSKKDSEYVQPATSAGVVCGSCRFFLRREGSEIGRCEVVNGAIAWFGTSNLYISANAEAKATFAAREE